MYENSRFLKNRFTFCGVNTNFGQQWAPPAYYHLTPIVSKGKHWKRHSHLPSPGALCNIRYPSEIHLKLKSREISFAHNSCLSWLIALKFCTEYGCITAVLCAKFQIDWTIETDVMDERNFARFELKMSFGRISYIAQNPRPALLLNRHSSYLLQNDHSIGTNVCHMCHGTELPKLYISHDIHIIYLPVHHDDITM